MSGLTSEEREVLRIKARQTGVDSMILYVERIVAARLADAEARAEAAEAKVARVEALLDLWMSWKGEPDHPGSSSPQQREQLRDALRGDQ